MVDNDRYTAYPTAVVSGEIVAGLYVRQACSRFLAMMEREDIEFHADNVEKVEKFISKLKHYKGKHAGQPFTLSDWQRWILAAIYGFYRTDGHRVTKNVYIEVARKNGKSAFCAAIALFELYAAGEASPECYLLANSAKQSQVLYQMCKYFQHNVDPNNRFSEVYRDKIKFAPNKGVLQSFAADATKLDGYNPSCFILDEYHAASNSDVYDVMKSGQGSRENPLSIVITTAGFNLLSPCYAMRSSYADLLAGLTTDDSTFAAIYTLDDGDDWRDPELWGKANPNIDVTISREYLSEQVTQAENNPSMMAGILTKNFNLWLQSSDGWLSADKITAVSRDMSLDEFRGQQVWIGVDLAAVSDLTAVSLMMVRDGIFFYKTFYYLPEIALNEGINQQKYREWKRNGHLNVTSGNVTDYDYILQFILNINSKYNMQIISILYDSWNASQFAIEATAAGLPLKPFSQSIGHFNRPTKEIERQIVSGKCLIDNNPVTRWCFQNVRLKADHNDNVKPIKTSKSDKIDGCIAMIQALGGYLESPYFVDTEIY